MLQSICPDRAIPGFDRQALNSVRVIRRNVDTQNARLYLARISRSVIPRVGRKLRHVSRRWLFDPSAPDFRARIGHHLWVAAGMPRLTHGNKSMAEQS